MAALGERRVALRARARGVAASVELALEGRAALGGLKLKLAFVELVGFDGFDVIDVSGATLSIVNERLDGDSAFVALSVALTRIVYDPSAGKFEAGKVYDQFPPARVRSCSRPRCPS